jgi:hypothetical protein
MVLSHVWLDECWEYVACWDTNDISLQFMALHERDERLQQLTTNEISQIVG